MILGEREYNLRLKGMNYKDIAKKTGCKGVGIVYYRIKEYCLNTGKKMPCRLIAKKKDKPALVKRYTVNQHGPYWHSLHCGKGMTARDISRFEHVDIEKVRKILYQYRQKMWGQG